MEIRAIVDKPYELARKIIAENRDKLDRISEMLLERETLDSEEISAAMEGRPLPARDRIVIPSWSDKRNQTKEKKRPASIFGTPKPATS